MKSMQSESFYDEVAGEDWDLLGGPHIDYLLSHHHEDSWREIRGMEIGRWFANDLRVEKVYNRLRLWVEKNGASILGPVE